MSGLGEVLVIAFVDRVVVVVPTVVVINRVVDGQYHLVKLLPVPEEVRPEAIALRNTNKKFIWEAGRKGKPCNPSYFNDKFREPLETIDGMSILTPHCCRVTYVSIMHSLGVKLETISPLLAIP